MKSILIVEDEDIIAKNISIGLKHLGYTNIHIAESGKKALKIIEEKHPDLILADIVLEDQFSGIELIQQVKKNYIEHCGQLITDKDLREMTLIMSLRIAGADAELAAAEFQALKALANMWRIRLSDVLGPYLA